MIRLFVGRLVLLRSCVLGKWVIVVVVVMVNVWNIVIVRVIKS